VLTVLMPLRVAPAQEQAAEAKPWEAWQPPSVGMPDPNAFELYELAFDLQAAIQARLEEEHAGDAEPPRLVLDAADGLDTETTRTLAAAYAPVFRTLEEAIAGEAQFPMLTDPEQQMPYFAKLREAARMFSSRARMYRADGRPLRAALDAIACMHIGADAMTQGTLISGLVGVAVQSIGLRDLDAAMPAMDATEAQIALNALRRAAAERASFTDVMRGEETYVRLAMIRYFPMFEEAQDAADRQLGPEAAGQLGAMEPARTWEEIGRYFSDLAAQADRPWCERTDPEEPANPLLANLTPAYRVASLKFAVMEARCALAQAALAAHIYLADTEGLPEPLDALVPDYLPDVPRDPFADAPLQAEYFPPERRAYPATGREPQGGEVLVIYSLGPDGNDDGGQDIGTSVDADSIGDIALVLAPD